MSAVVPLYIKKAYYDEPSFRDSKVVFSIYDNGFKSNFVENFNEQLKFKDVTSDDLKMMNSPVNYNELCKLAMAYSDGVVMNGENIDTELIEYAKSLNIPVVENQQGFDAYADACNSLYDKVLGDNE